MNTAFRVAIPARYSSSRLPGKPLLDIAGLPMIQRVYQVAEQSGAGQIVVATDDQRIADVVSDFGGQVYITRSDHASGTDRLAEVAIQMGWPDDDIIVNLQGDEPMLPPELLAQVASGLADHPRAGMATLSAPISTVAELFDPNIVKLTQDKQGYALYFSRAPIPYHRDLFRQGQPDTLPENISYWRHLGIYAYRAVTLRAYPELPPAPFESVEALEQLRALWHDIAIHVQPALVTPPAGVDTAEDLARLNAQFGAKP